tara:strand:- start:391 stop:705 length:315 start_codon:yes stop_codon:yes gene_type:complete
MSYLNRPGMGMIVTMHMGIGTKENKGQSQPESQENPKLTMLQVTAKQSGTGNQKGCDNHRFLDTFRPKEGACQQGKKGEKNRESDAMNRAYERHEHARAIETFP